MSTNGKQVPAFEYHERFLSKILIDKVTGCWNWTGAKITKGYGVFNLNTSLHKAHRISFSIFKGDIKKGLLIDHKCRNRACVNPEHIRQTTAKINLNENKKDTKRKFCNKGHELSEENRDAKSKRCKACKKISNDYWNNKKK